jgi:ribonucleoside-diphosphate reductase alpha chain
MMDIYYAAWERGVKTTYYLHMKPRHTAEQSTVKVNKTEELETKNETSVTESAGAGSAQAPSTPARRGFGGLK